ncbi:hypothetical protein I6I07_19305 [Achromobacter deleyi]|uniref:Phage protein n=1 Tax=Achromobacter deleyi TaxID=1353891 RepID=A0A7T4E1L7_9BURK|nr:hypothetical protein [Achromobacter deleyi]QQB32795.1 hypothetical protein I6I07_19305 [Achromobacter deleyi]
MNAPAPKTTTAPDEALSSLMGAALDVPAPPEQPEVPAWAPDNTLARTGNTEKEQAMWFGGMEQAQVNAQDNAAIRAQAQEYGSLAEVAQRIEQYIGRYGREDTATLLLYEAMNALRRPAPSAGDALTAAARDVLAERQRQVSNEGWTPEHDDQYTAGDMASAAACYASQGRYHYPEPGEPGPNWPWAAEWWKPSTYRRNLEKAGALILAEIERLDRAAALTAQEGGK